MATRVRDARDRFEGTSNTVRRDTENVQEFRSDAARELDAIRNRGQISHKGGQEVHVSHGHGQLQPNHGNQNPFDDSEQYASQTYRPPLSYKYITVDPYNHDWEPLTRDASSFSPDEDAKILHKAMKGLGTDEKAIINVLTKRSNAQRQVIAKQFQLLYKKDLIKELKSELSGKLEDAILGLMTPPSIYDAQCLHKAMAGLGTDEKVLIEIICTRSPHELASIKRAYKDEFKTELEKDITGDTSGFFRTLLLAKVNEAVRQSQVGQQVYEISPKQAFHEAQALWETGPKYWQTDPAFFTPIFTQRSDEHMRQVFQDYKQIGQIDIDRDIEKELKGDTKDTLLAYVKSSKNRAGYFADRLNHAMKGMGVDAKTVIRIIVSRSEKDLGNIKREYSFQYRKSLEDAVSEDFSGDDKKVLLGILNPSQK